MPADKKVFSLNISDKKELEKGISDHTVDNTAAKFSTILVTNQPRTYNFLDESKKEHRGVLTMYNLTPSACCFWCRHSFDTIPIGCPIDYRNNQILKTYYSEITKDEYKIMGVHGDIDKIEDKNIQVLNKSHFLVDGAFCSFNCCKSYIEDNNRDIMYDKSMQLLYNMYHTCFPESKIDDVIPSAPHWRLLKSYGGNMSIEEFRKSAHKIQYTPKGITNQSISWVFQENITF